MAITARYTTLIFFICRLLNVLNLRRYPFGACALKQYQRCVPTGPRCQPDCCIPASAHFVWRATDRKSVAFIADESSNPLLHNSITCWPEYGFGGDRNDTTLRFPHAGYQTATDEGAARNRLLQPVTHEGA